MCQGLTYYLFSSPGIASHRITLRLKLELSGQCFSSEAWGGRSANRGQCAQACRMPYGLIGAYVRSSFLLYSARNVCHIVSYRVVSCRVVLC